MYVQRSTCHPVRDLILRSGRICGSLCLSEKREIPWKSTEGSGYGEHPHESERAALYLYQYDRGRYGGLMLNGWMRGLAWVRARCGSSSPWQGCEN
jgi:hypothetical protein